MGHDPMILSPSEVAGSYQMWADAGLAEPYRWLEASLAARAHTAYRRAIASRTADSQPEPATTGRL